MRLFVFMLFIATAVLISFSTSNENKDPLVMEIVTSDLDRFWEAMSKAGENVDPQVLEQIYLKPGSKGVQGFMKGRISSAENLSKVIRAHSKYYRSIKASTDSIKGMKDAIRHSLVKLKEIYPQAVFPPVYFVIGALNSGGTATNDGLIIGAEMYALTPETPLDELSPWLKTVIKPVREVPHIVAHELIHFQQKYDDGTLLSASIKEGAADFLAELVSGKHINQHVHDFADAREKELWLEFKERMNGTDFNGWLYSSAKERPNDLGYWMGYKITKAYYDKAPDKKQAVRDILTIKNFQTFLEQSGYADRFN